MCSCEGTVVFYVFLGGWRVVVRLSLALVCIHTLVGAAVGVDFLHALLRVCYDDRMAAVDYWRLKAALMTSCVYAQVLNSVRQKARGPFAPLGLDQRSRQEGV